LRPVQVIYLSRRDTIDTACELLHQATPGSQVWLVAPWRARLARNLINLKRLARAGQDAALDLRLVSSHLETHALAREAGLPVYFIVPWKLRRYRVARQRGVGGLAARVVPVDGDLGWRFRGRPRPLSIGAALLSLVVIAVLTAVLVGAAAAMGPSAEVILEPLAQPVSAKFTVTADITYRDADYGKAIIPARAVQVIVEGRGETPVSGAVDLADARATGEVVFVNLTTNAVKVPQGTAVRTGSGTNVRFYTVAAVELPAALHGQARVGVIAVDAGPVGNVQPLTINVVEGALARTVSVINDTATSGGSVKRQGTVAAEDFDRVRAELVAKLQKDAYAQLVAELAEGEFVPPNSLDVQVMSQNFDQVIAQQSDVLSMEMKVVAKGIAINDANLRGLATRFLESKAEAGYSLIPDSLKVVRSEEMEAQERAVRFEVSAEGVVAPVIDEQRIKNALRAKKAPEAQAWLKKNLKLRSDPQITVLPAGWEYLPALPGRIKLIISSGTP